MKKFVLAASAGLLALSLASCGGSTQSCTEASIQAKGKELQEAMQAAMTKDPAKAATNAQTWAQKAQDLMVKAQAAGAKPTDEVCKAFDELIATVKS